MAHHRKVLKNMAGSRRSNAGIQEDRRRANQTPDIVAAKAEAEAAALLAAQTPMIGMSVRWWGEEDPPGDKFMIENGRLLNVSEYPEAYAFFGRRFSDAGDPETKFRIPDSRNRTGVGVQPGNADRQLGNIFGADTHQLTEAEGPTHDHSGSTGGAGSHAHGGGTGGSGAHAHGGGTDGGGSHQHSYPNGGGTLGVSGGAGQAANANAGTTNAEANHNHAIEAAPDHTHTISSVAAHNHTIASSGSGNAHNNVQRSIAVNYAIRVSY